MIRGLKTMKTTGVIRKLDELGRITLPIELRRSLDLDVKDGLEITVQDDCIILKKAECADIFTGSTDEPVSYTHLRGDHFIRANVNARCLGRLVLHLGHGNACAGRGRIQHLDSCLVHGSCCHRDNLRLLLLAL